MEAGDGAWSTLDQDDLYVDMTFAAVLDEKGLDATTEDFRRHVPGCPVPTVARQPGGSPRFETRCSSDAQRNPGVQRARQRHRLPDRGRLHRPDDAGDAAGLERSGRTGGPGDELTATASTAVCLSAPCMPPPSSRTNPRRLVEAGVAALPPESEYARLISDVLQWSLEHPDDWIAVWQLIQDDLGRRRALSPRSTRPIQHRRQDQRRLCGDLGLLYGRGDFRRHHGDRHPLRSGFGLQSRQCGRSARRGSRLRGHPRGVPERDTRHRRRQHFSYTDYSFNTIVESTMKTGDRHGRTPRRQS